MSNANTTCDEDVGEQGNVRTAKLWDGVVSGDVAYWLAVIISCTPIAITARHTQANATAAQRAISLYRDRR